VARIQARGRSRLRDGTGALWWGIVLITLAALALIALALAYYYLPRKPVLDVSTLCPVTGPEGIIVVLVDTSDDLPATTQEEVLGLLTDQIKLLPDYYRLDIRVLDIPRSRSRSLFSKCNPGNGEGLSEWTNNPRIARMRWLESFEKPAKEAVDGSLASARSKSSPIMGAIQDIALDQFSTAAVQGVPKTLIVISDMLEFTPDYGQYQGDLSWQRYKQSPAYLKYRTDLHGAHVKIDYVRRKVLPLRFDSVQHIEFWRRWIIDNEGVYEPAHSLQGLG
jgi:hypothetical protein